MYDTETQTKVSNHSHKLKVAFLQKTGFDSKCRVEDYVRLCYGKADEQNYFGLGLSLLFLSCLSFGTDTLPLPFSASFWTL